MKKPELELTVTVYNINPGMNEELLKACRLLKKYVQFTEKIRENRKMSIYEYDQVVKSYVSTLDVTLKQRDLYKCNVSLLS